MSRPNFTDYLVARKHQDTGVCTPMLGMGIRQEQTGQVPILNEKAREFEVLKFFKSVVKQSQYNKQVQRLDSLLNLQPNWDTYDAVVPNRQAVDKAKSFIRLAANRGVFPDGVFPIPEGGVTVEFHRKHQYYSLEFHNDSEVIFLVDSHHQDDIPDARKLLASNLDAEFEVVIREMDGTLQLAFYTHG